jgi:hypothetical protein
MNTGYLQEFLQDPECRGEQLWDILVLRAEDLRVVRLSVSQGTATLDSRVLPIPSTNSGPAKVRFETRESSCTNSNRSSVLDTDVTGQNEIPGKDERKMSRVNRA